MQAFFFIGSEPSKQNKPFIVFANSEEEALSIASNVLSEKAFGNPEKLTPGAAQLISEVNNKGKFQSY